MTECHHHLHHPLLQQLKLHLRPYIPEATRVSHWKPSQSCLFNFMHSGLKAQGPNQYYYSAKIFKVLSHCCGENLNQESLKASSKPLLNKVPGVEWTRCSLSFCMCMNTSCYSSLLDVDVWVPTTRLLFFGAGPSSSHSSYTAC